jgi:hypothetical protein
MNEIFHIQEVGGAGSELSRALVAARLQGNLKVSVSMGYFPLC